MRTETLWQRRGARMHWWRQVMDRPATLADWGEVLDEMARLRFGTERHSDVTGCSSEIASMLLRSN